MDAPTEVFEQLRRIEGLIDRAADVCDADPSVPLEVKERVRQLDDETDATKYEYLLENDRYAIGDHVEAIEQLLEEARDACERSEQVDAAIGNVLSEATREVGDLRRRLH